MNKEVLEKVGVACFGNTWQSDMACALNVNPRTVRRWASGESLVPQGLKNDLQLVIADRHSKLDEALNLLKEYNMKKVTFITAFRKNENTVCVMYRHNARSQDFVIEWSNIHPATGEVDDYDLQLSCLAPSENLVNEVIEAIKNGEDDDLYLEIRDTFDRLDCEDI